MRSCITYIIILGAAWLSVFCGSSGSPSGTDRLDEQIFDDPDQPLDARVQDLSRRLTFSEKIAFLVNQNPAIPRLGIEAYDWWGEGLHGVARAGLGTVFPQAIGLGATWDPELIHRVAAAIANEARAKHHDALRQGIHDRYLSLNLWSPNINIFRDPRWGRGQETYGEDPYLTSRMVVQFVRGLQGDHPTYLKVSSMPKHFAVHSGPEDERHRFDSIVNERDLRDTYLPAFRAGVIEGEAAAVMCSYNRINGEPACVSALLEEILRNQWGFTGYVLSDCSALQDLVFGHQTAASQREAAAQALLAGTDQECGASNFTETGEDVYSFLSTSSPTDKVSEERIDEALGRLLRVRMRLGSFDPPERVPFAQTSTRVVDSAEHRALALETARKSIVLLKNKDSRLPLPTDLGTVAVIGPNADDPRVLLGNYHGDPSSPVTVLDGIKAAVSPTTRVIHASGAPIGEGIPLFEEVPPEVLFHQSSEGLGLVPGLRASYYKDVRLRKLDPAIAFSEPAFLTRIEPKAAFVAAELDAQALSPFTLNDFAVVWEGILVPPSSGTYTIGGFGFHNYRASIDGQEVFAEGIEFFQNYKSGQIDLEAGREYQLRVEHATDNLSPNFRLLWERPQPNRLQEAVRAAQQADVTILVLGLSNIVENEELRDPISSPGFVAGDRSDIALPPTQRELLDAVVAAGETSVVVVLVAGSIVVVDDSAIDGLLHAWYPGQAGGTAVADVLFGKHNPSGRLPVTSYQSVTDLGDYRDYSMSSGMGRTYRYFRGRPQYPFGYGLSYTQFRYANFVVSSTMAASDSDELVSISVDVTNVGPVEGEEVVQLYARDVEASFPVPLRELVGFERVVLEPAETASVTMSVSARQLSLIDDRGRRVLEPGLFELSVGGGPPSAVPTLTATAAIDGVAVVLKP